MKFQTIMFKDHMQVVMFLSRAHFSRRCVLSASKARVQYYGSNSISMRQKSSRRSEGTYLHLETWSPHSFPFFLQNLIFTSFSNFFWRRNGMWNIMTFFVEVLHFLVLFDHQDEESPKETYSIGFRTRARHCKPSNSGYFVILVLQKKYTLIFMYLKCKSRTVPLSKFVWKRGKWKGKVTPHTLISYKWGDFLFNVTKEMQCYRTGR